MAQQTKTNLGQDGHCLIMNGTQCQSHSTIIPSGQDCCGKCPGTGHRSAILLNGKHVDDWSRLELLAAKLGMKLGGRNG